MPHEEKSLSSEPTDGDKVEARVAQVWFWEGFYSKRGIDVQAEYGGDLTQITDLDLLAFDFNPALRMRKFIGESKSGSGKSAPKALDRMIWQRGLRAFVGAEAAELTINSKVTEQNRKFGRELGVSVQTLSDLSRREEALLMAEVEESGSHGAAAFALVEWVRKYTKSEPELEVIFRFLRSKVWFLDSFTAVKQTISVIETLSKQWVVGHEDDHKKAVRWLLAEAVSVFSLMLVDICSEARLRPRFEFDAFVAARLADGVVPSSEMKQLSKSIDKFIAGLLVAAKATPAVRTGAMGAFDPVPPAYADSFAELAWRLSRWVRASDLPRQIDFLAHERIGLNRPVPTMAAQRIQLSNLNFQHSVSLVCAFLRGHAALSPDASETLLNLAVQPEETMSDAVPSDADVASPPPLALKRPGSGADEFRGQDYLDFNDPD
ncbi:hypothetical protein [Arthrobacter sp. FB24]|uniref:hypothetical protein n=1 Tax=Arthrobacter sp. (strain FB24) TaxID=290399 RepID=UPI0000527C3F|nr:hypothetical protein [Arthrobacter sp. FB24]